MQKNATLRIQESKNEAQWVQDDHILINWDSTQISLHNDIQLNADHTKHFRNIHVKVKKKKKKPTMGAGN